MYNLLSAREIRKKLRMESMIDVSLQAIHATAQKIGYRERHVGNKVGYHKSVYLALWQHISELLECDKELKEKKAQKQKKEPILGDYHTYNGERDNIDYEWEKNENKIMENGKKVLIGLWLDDKRKDPTYFLNQKEKPNENGKPTSGSIVRDWYKNNMNGIDIRWTAVQNFEQFKNYIEQNGVPDFVSLDHDLGDEPSNKIKKSNNERFESGADCALWLVSYCLRKHIPIPRNYIHSANDNHRVFISKAFRMGRIGKDPMANVDIDNIDEFRAAADRFRASIMNPKAEKSIKKFLKNNSEGELGTADRLAKMRGIDKPTNLFGKTSFRENNSKINKALIRLTESDLHKDLYNRKSDAKTI